jgi:hypothetical protein
MYLVTKAFVGEGCNRVVGEVVNGKSYKLLNKLLIQRYLAKLDSKIKPCQCQLCDRQFIDEKILELHYITEHPDQIEIVDDKEKGVVT